MNKTTLFHFPVDVETPMLLLHRLAAAYHWISKAKPIAVSRPVWGGWERVWYTLFAHARNIPNILWNQNTLVICSCYVTSRFVVWLNIITFAIAELNKDVPAIWEPVKMCQHLACSSAKLRLTPEKQMEYRDIIRTFTWPFLIITCMGKRCVPGPFSSPLKWAWEWG